MSDQQVDGWVDYAFWAMDQAGWYSLECPQCGYPRLYMGDRKRLAQCNECDDPERDHLDANQ